MANSLFMIRNISESKNGEGINDMLSQLKGGPIPNHR